MSTTSAGLGRAAVAALVDCEIALALLHVSDLPANEAPFSDVDLVVGVPPRTILSLAAESWAARGLHPIIAWPYDVGGTMSVFLASPDARDGVQLDMLYDLRGLGRYGIRSDGALTMSEPGDFVPTLAEPARLVYLWRKRGVKADPRARESLQKRARSIDSHALERASIALTGSPGVADEILGRARSKSSRPPRAVLARLERMYARSKHPVGFWVHTESTVVATELERRLSRILRPVAIGSPPGRLARPFWYVGRVASVRFRPGVFISVGPGCPGGVDAKVGGDPDAAARELVHHMKRRLI